MKNGLKNIKDQLIVKTQKDSVRKHIVKGEKVIKDKNKNMQVSIVSVFWNESRYLKEWIEFHLLVGVDKIYLTNNNSTDDYMTILKPYIDNGKVILSNIYVDITKNPGSRDNEVLLVNEWVKEMNRIVKHSQEDWIIHVSTDEFIFPTKKDNIKDVLATFPENVGEISVNWVLFGNNGIELKENELLIDKIRKSSEDSEFYNLHVKPILRPKAVKYIPSVHFSNLLSNYIKVDSNKNKNNFKTYYETEKFVADELVINHYRFRDLAYSKEKIKIYELWGKSGRDYQMNQYNDVDNQRIVKYVDKLKKNMGFI